jgi:hypothetical protein
MTTGETLLSHAITVEEKEIGLGRVLALVQDHLVISTFPGHQFEAAIDLARVLCRALTQPVDVFRLRRSDAAGVHSGAVATTSDPAWTHLAHVDRSLLTGVHVEICDPESRPASAQ